MSFRSIIFKLNYFYSQQLTLTAPKPLVLWLADFPPMATGEGVGVSAKAKRSGSGSWLIPHTRI